MSVAKIIKSLIYLALFSLIGYMVKDNFNAILLIFSHVKWWVIALLVLLQIPIIASGGLAFQILSRAFSYRLRFLDWVGLSFIANFLNQLLPYRPGFFYRYLYLRQHYQMQVNQYLMMMSMYFLLMLAISALFTFVGWSLSLPETFHHLLFYAEGIFIIILLFLFLSHLGKGYLPTELLIDPQASWLKKNIHFSVYALRLMVSNPALLLGCSLVFILLNALTAYVLYWLFIAVHTPLPFIDCIFLAGIMVIAQLFPITPGNIGVLETLFGSITQIMVQDFGLGFSVVALYRACLWIPSFALGIVFSWQLAGTIFPHFDRNKFGPNLRG